MANSSTSPSIAMSRPVAALERSTICSVHAGSYHAIDLQSRVWLPLGDMGAIAADVSVLSDSVGKFLSAIVHVQLDRHALAAIEARGELQLTPDPPDRAELQAMIEDAW